MCHECQVDDAKAICPRIAESIAASLTATNRFRVNELQFEVRRGEIVLRGRVSTWYQKQLAQQAVVAVAPELSLCNLIEVTPDPSQGNPPSEDASAQQRDYQ